MSVDPEIRAEPSLTARIKGLLLDPKTEWPRIAAEPATVGSLYVDYIVPVAGFAVLCSFLRDLLGTTIFGVTYRIGFFEALSSAIWMLAASLIGAFVVSLIMDWLAPRFGGQSDRIGALKLAGYSATASWLSNVFLLVPWLGFLTILGIYSLYLISTGAPVLLKIPQERALPFTASLVGIGIVASLIFYATLGPMLRPSAVEAPTRVSNSDAPTVNQDRTSGGINIPGVGKINLGKLDELANRIEKLAKGGEALAPITGEELRALLPASLPGLSRTETSLADNAAAGLDMASASGVYINGDKTLTLSISDMGVAGAMASLTGAIGMSSSEQKDSVYRKLSTIDGRMTMEEFDTGTQIGSYGTVIGDRVMVKAEGHGVPAAQLIAAVRAVDAKLVETLAKR